MQKHQFTAHIGEHEIIIETGTLAQQAGGAVTVRCGETVVLATATATRTPRTGIDFFPLSVDYEERMYAAGKIPASFFRREGRPSEQAILLCRLVDRPLRPLFAKGLRNEVQIVLTSLSSDEENFIDILSIIGASAALHISNIPWGGPVGAVRVGQIDGEFVFNPTDTQRENSTLDLRLAGTADAILMVEAGANEIPEDVMLEALRRGHEAMQDVIRVQNEMREKLGKPKSEFPVFLPSAAAKEAVKAQVATRLSEFLATTSFKAERNEGLDAFQQEVGESFADEYEVSEVSEAFQDLVRQDLRARILNEGIRPDGRDAKTVRPISCAVGLLSRTHGSALFTRGETQVLTIATLGTPRDEQTIDSLDADETKRYMHHYNFPPYSTGEVSPMRGPKRREIGHGALAERALVPVLPPESEFPYTVRLVSEVLSSNGSTSMASVCASTLALMDAGVPIQTPVAGVAMGLISEGDRYAILTDIIGMEDHLGDMDFKVAGTRHGITALQMDLKLQGLSDEILTKALAQAREARLFILNKMLEALPAPRPDLSPYAPRITIVKIHPEKIGTLIGPGGKMVRRIQEETGVKIDIEDDGSVFVSSTNGPSAERAVEIIEELTSEVELGKIYNGKVVRTTDFGAFVEILPGRDGLVHISQLADYRAPTVEDVVKVGDEVQVMVIGIDDQGKIRLSRAAVLEGLTLEEAQERDRKPGPAPRRGGSGPGERTGGSRFSRDNDRDRRSGGGRNGGSGRSGGGFRR
ncbi:MAG: polyribonucleotide nucleotidyltransferase [Anaerolineae bacterium]|nr:polyribonucleotide nucleotidyltransferase [Anaerolineae bacterium]